MAKRKWLLPALAVAIVVVAVLGVLWLNKDKGKEQAPPPSETPLETEAPKALSRASGPEGPITVLRKEGERFFPEEGNWVYHFSYAYPFLEGEDYTSALINDTYQMALDEMAQLVIPMFANAEDMRFDGKNEVNHDFTVACNNGKVLSILQTKSQTMGAEGVRYSLEAQTFDVDGMYAGETLTLRGVALIQAGVNAEELDDVMASDYPAFARIINGSSDEMALALLPVLYQEFQRMQGEGTVKADCDYAEFQMEFSPARDFYTDQEGNLVFFFPPTLMAEPGLNPPCCPLTPAAINDLLPEKATETQE